MILVILFLAAYSFSILVDNCVCASSAAAKDGSTISPVILLKPPVKLRLACFPSGVLKACLEWFLPECGRRLMESFDD